SVKNEILKFIISNANQIMIFEDLEPVLEVIFSYLDDSSLRSAELVCKQWLWCIEDSMLWRKLIKQKVHRETVWKGFGKRRGWMDSLNTFSEEFDHKYFRALYLNTEKDIKNLESNWKTGKHQLTTVSCEAEYREGVYCLQSDEEQIVSGHRDNTVKIWDTKTLACKKMIKGHTGSVLCLQYEGNLLITGSSDSTVRIWNLETGQEINKLMQHSDAVLTLRLQNSTLITGSKDRSIIVWDVHSPNAASLRMKMEGHEKAVNVIDFDDKYIVSGSGDRTIKVWDSNTFNFIRNLAGHSRGVNCLQYRTPLVVSGSTDQTIMLWNVEQGTCLTVFKTYSEMLVRCLQFNDHYIVSGGHDGVIKVWNLKAALHGRPEAELFIHSCKPHNNRISHLSIDHFQIVSCSLDDTICMLDFDEASFEVT
uniref:F-box domain-containing protein n=2 Tax=Clytia hemisphaerica TaxID=252671 RepID=A0A7M5UZ17_9CNID